MKQKKKQKKKKKASHKNTETIRQGRGVLRDRNFDKYDHYLRSVQSPKEDALFLRKVYQELNRKEPKLLSEHFCGTFAFSCEWVKLSQQNKVCALDIDLEPISYGKRHYLSRLSEDQQKRILVRHENVLSFSFESDIVVALNFSYFIFKKRVLMKQYFQHVLSQLKENGLFVVDIFGGSECYSPNEEETVFKNFSYFWDQGSFNPILNHAKFYIHFKRKGEKKRKNVFTYDWRMWSIPELRDIMSEVGFRETYVYWEREDEGGEESGEFYASEEEESRLAWVAYLIGKK